jgi:hypothetical protein
MPGKGRTKAPHAQTGKALTSQKRQAQNDNDTSSSTEDETLEPPQKWQKGKEVVTTINDSSGEEDIIRSRTDTRSRYGTEQSVEVSATRIGKKLRTHPLMDCRRGTSTSDTRQRLGHSW